MTITNITQFNGYDAHRLEQLEQKHQEAQKAAAGAQEGANDRISISEEGRLKANALKAAQESDGVRADKVADLKAKIEAGEYKPEGKDIAASLVKQELDVWG
jgi:negative regulator of flagellin synthesis FlgM